MSTSSGALVLILAVILSAAAGGKDEFDYVLVGGGAAGIPLAYTLAENGKDVLLIERGGPRKDNPEDTTTISQWGSALLNKDIAQEIRTLDKQITNVASILSGGTALSGGVQIEEVPEYFDHLRDKFDADFDEKLVNESYAWTRERVGQVMGYPDLYGDAWIGALQDLGFGPFAGESPSIANGSWNGYSLFENDGKKLSPDRFRRATDVIPLERPLDSLKILTRHNALRVEFDTSDETGNPKATCVVYTKSPDAFETIDSRANAGLPVRPSLFDKWKKVDDTDADLRRACIREGGEIFISAGAILSPVILMNSGVGPKDVVEKVMKNTGGKLIRDVPQLGQNLHDRWAVQFGVFFKKPVSRLREPIPVTTTTTTPQPDIGPPDGGGGGGGIRPAPGGPIDDPDDGGGFEELDPPPPRSRAKRESFLESDFPITVNAVSGVKKVVGESCPEDFGFNTTPDCFYVTAEEGTGIDFAGLVLSTRAAFPPVFRGLPEVDFLVALLSECLDKPDSILCAAFQPVFECTSRTAGWITFAPVPKSRGYVTVNEWGEPIVASNYLTDEKGEDLNNDVVGLETLLRVLGSGRFDDLFERRGPQSCVVYIFNKLVDLLILATRALPIPFPGDPDFQQTDLLASLPSFLAAETDEKTGRRSDSKEDPSRTFLEEALLWAELQKRKHEVIERSRKAWREGEGEGDGEHSEPEWRGDKSEVAEWLREQVALASTPPSEPEGFMDDLRCEFVTSEECERIRQLKNAERFAILPTLPTDLDDREKLEGFIKTHGNGMWHWSGSTAMGSVVDDKLRVIGVDNLAVADAGVFPQASRMNVQAHSIMIGRYAAAQREEQQGGDDR
ncbi:unnamed protein product [Vitrella brassicaformis CCMP3155]|uniref:Glucose-methanol-choline oxidoreductase N-terminal domain-containing protein n=2 Tax=Vitrella brassicaformis TaxID=1169539 RepID=A0A0G4G0H7_VITBC|nr:unnamed protein product [Vitrella brassicaformis CCMP3155]|eukprot:CEM21190.1 unnamed protein product [Vitrella brassicaformis CCMP3155]